MEDCLVQNMFLSVGRTYILCLSAGVSLWLAPLCRVPRVQPAQLRQQAQGSRSCHIVQTHKFQVIIFILSLFRIQTIRIHPLFCFFAFFAQKLQTKILKSSKIKNRIFFNYVGGTWQKRTVLRVNIVVKQNFRAFYGSGFDQNADFLYGAGA